MKKPKYNFCWHCGNKLRGNFYREYTNEHGTFIVHKQCKVELETGNRLTIGLDAPRENVEDFERADNYN